MRKYTKEGMDKNKEQALTDIDVLKRKDIIRRAVEKAVNECIAEGILKDFFLANKMEVIKMGVLGYSAKRHLEMVHREGYTEGFSEGKTEGLDEGIIGTVAILRDLGHDEAMITETIGKQYNLTSEQAKKYFD